MDFSGLSITLWFTSFESNFLPAVVAASLPLSYRWPKPFYVLWAVGFAKAALTSVITDLLYVWQPANSNIINSAPPAIFEMVHDVTVYLIMLSPYIVAWLLHFVRGRWAGVVKPPILEAMAVFVLIVFIPIWLSLSTGINLNNFSG